MTILKYEAQASQINKFEALPTAAQQEINCLADNMYFEAGQEPIDGQRAVAYVTMNRLRSEEFPTTICKIIQQKIPKTNKCQFSWWCNSTLRNKSIQRKFDKITYNKIRDLAMEIYLTYNVVLDDITKGAMFFHANRIPAKRLTWWKNNLEKTVIIGQHTFYKKA